MELPKKVTDYIDGLTDEQQDNVLTGTMARGGNPDFVPGAPGCLMQLAEQKIGAAHDRRDRHVGLWSVIDDACLSQTAPHDTTPAFGAAVRDYICELRTNRELATVPVKVYPMSEARVVRASL